MGAALESYKSLVLTPLHDILASDKPFDQILEALASFITQDRQRRLGRCAIHPRNPLEKAVKRWIESIRRLDIREVAQTFQ